MQTKQFPTPGDLLRVELDARGWTQKDCAELTGLPIYTIGLIARNERVLVAEVALRLGAAGLRDASYWVAAQADFDRAVAFEKCRDDLSDIPKRIRLFEQRKLDEKQREFDEIGRRYSRLVVLGWIPYASGHERLVVCLCDCGIRKSILFNSIKNGGTRSCGCLSIGNKNPLTHGHTANNVVTNEYKSWKKMKERCYNHKHPSWKYYGGAGIIVCFRWRASFAEFFKDMGPKPSSQHSIDRIDSNKGYKPSNCRWATAKEQANNRRNNVKITAFGETLSLEMWAEKTGISREILRKRIGRAGWAPEQILSISGKV